ncbi:MAG: hypothetical protein ACFCBU_02150, partial [Cyanophyceae cyanobacterium]
TTRVQQSYQALENRAETEQLNEHHSELLDLAEREAANSAAVANLLIANETTDEIADGRKSYFESLQRISPDLDDRWRGAIYSLNPNNPDAARHFCTSSREIFTQILEIKAPKDSVFSLMPDCDTTPNGLPTRRSRIKYFLFKRGMNIDELTDFVEEDIANIVELFRLFNDGTHGRAGTHDFDALRGIKNRVEDGLSFLFEVIGDS